MMKNFFLSAAFVLTMATAALAQRTPAPSPAATVIQAVGITDFTVKYSRPGIKGRQVFGHDTPLAPYGKVWRTGANAATTLESTTDFSFGGKKVPAGKYALVTIPDGAQWVLILSRNAAQEGGYKEADDAARVKVAPASAPFRETFQIAFDNITDSTAIFSLSWGTVNVPVRIEVATTDLTLKGFKQALAQKPEDAAALQGYSTYLLTKGFNLNEALALADKSIGLKPSYQNLWLKARILSGLGKGSEAIATAEKALSAGTANGDSSFGFYKGQIEAALKEWKAAGSGAKKK